MNDVYHVVYAISSAHKPAAGVSSELLNYLANLVQCVHLVTGHGF
jgi:hypothetical protein